MVVDFRARDGQIRQALVFVVKATDLPAAKWLTVAKERITALFVRADGGCLSEDVSDGTAKIRLEVGGLIGHIRIESGWFYGFVGVPMNADAPGGWGFPFTEANKPLGTALSTVPMAGGLNAQYYGGAVKYWAKNPRKGKPDLPPVGSDKSFSLAGMPGQFKPIGLGCATNQTWLGDRNKTVIGYLAMASRGKAVNRHVTRLLERSNTVNHGEGFTAVNCQTIGAAVLGCGSTTMFGNRYSLIIQMDNDQWVAEGNVSLSLKIARWKGDHGFQPASKVSAIANYQFNKITTGAPWYYYSLPQPFYFSPDGHHAIGLIIETVYDPVHSVITRKNSFIFRLQLTDKAALSYTVTGAGGFAAKGAVGATESAVVFADFKLDGTESFIVETREYLTDAGDGVTDGNWGTRHNWFWDGMAVYNWTGRDRVKVDGVDQTMSMVQACHADLRYGVFAFATMDWVIGNLPTYKADLFRVRADHTFDVKNFTQAGVPHTDIMDHSSDWQAPWRSGVANDLNFNFAPNDCSLASSYALDLGDHAPYWLHDLHFEAVTRYDLKSLFSFRIGTEYAAGTSPTDTWYGSAMDRHSLFVDWEATDPAQKFKDVAGTLGVSNNLFRVYAASEG